MINFWGWWAIVHQIFAAGGNKLPPAHHPQIPLTNMGALWNTVSELAKRPTLINLAQPTSIWTDVLESAVLAAIHNQHWLWHVPMWSHLRVKPIEHDLDSH